MPRNTQHFLRERADKENVCAAHAFAQAGTEHALVVYGNAHVGADDGKLRAFFQKQQVRHAVVHLVVAYGDDIGREQIHHLYGGKTAVLAVYDRAVKHVARNGVEQVLLLLPRMTHIACKPRHAACKNTVFFGRQKVAVQVVGMQQGKFNGIGHENNSPHEE